MEFENIIFETEKRVATITFNRPEALNALNSNLLQEFGQALDAIEADDEIRALVLTGAGDKSFVAGADIGEIQKCDALQGKKFARKGQEILDRLEELPIVVIAAVNGFALGGGCEMSLACDFIYASETAIFGLPEINLGIMPGFGGTQRLPRLIGTNMAKEMIFTGKMIPAAEAREIGLVNQVCAPDALMDEVKKVAKSISFKGRVSIRAAKQAVNSGMNVDLGTGCRLEVDAFALCLASEDAKEGTTAFLEKRKPTFTGKLA
ncbi:MAG: enoyl-CoA hydratase/isomerase family protein [Desulfobacterales bacterium]|nr:enoyl-CoA hydratase/isomerase family protein [Desulfobacterales bacterium]